jgi:hypothetical protein
MPPCALCQEFTHEKTHPFFIVATSFAELLSSAYGGCQMCEILKEGLQRCFSPQLNGQTSVDLNMWISDLHPKRRLYGRLYLPSEKLEFDVFVPEGT